MTTRNHGDPTIREARAAVTEALRNTPMKRAVQLTGCSEGTLLRIRRGEDTRLSTLTRIARAMGYEVRIRLEKQEE